MRPYPDSLLALLILPTIILSWIVVGRVPSVQFSPPPTAIRLFFHSRNDIAHAAFDTPIAVTHWTAGAHPVDAALRSLLAGPTEDDRRAGATGLKDLQSLLPSYIGVSVRDGIATVNFQRSALPILNGTAARQLLVKAPIEATLKGFPSVHDVRYAIDGTLFDQWDA